MPPTIESPKVVQTTVRLPEQLYRELKDLLDQGCLEGNSLNDVVIDALKRSARAAQEKLIDDEFASMATDERYLQQSKVLAGEFARADWETLPQDSATRAAR